MDKQINVINAINDVKKCRSIIINDVVSTRKDFEFLLGRYLLGEDDFVYYIEDKYGVPVAKIITRE